MDKTSIWVILISFVVPFFTIGFMYCYIVRINKITTGEIKFIWPPETLLKVLALLLIVVVSFVLAFLKILDQAVVATILGSVAAGTIGMDFKGKQ